jgi:hypothetical protein
MTPKQRKQLAKISVVLCPICKREVVSESGIIQPHADMVNGGYCKNNTRKHVYREG